MSGVPLLLDILNKSCDYLKQKNIENPRLEAQLLIGHVLKLTKMDLYLHFDQPIVEEELNQIRALLKRRVQREPLQYILGNTPFRKIILKTDGRALIPRPETEQLLDCLPPLVSLFKIPRVLDVGTGSGALALSVKSEWPDTKVQAIDISTKALELARENKGTLGLDVDFYESNLLQVFPADVNWDIIISNPPYISNEEIPTLQDEIKYHEPHIALNGGAEGSEVLKNIISVTYRRCSFLVLEHGSQQAQELSAFALQIGWKIAESKKDWNGLDRFLICKQI